MINAGAVTWGNGTTGETKGSVSEDNSLVSTEFASGVGSDGITELSNGNYVVSSPGWALALGAVTWGSGTMGVKGVVSASNSLVGSSTYGFGRAGSGGITALSNGNYVVSSHRDFAGGGGRAGAVTWGSGTTGVKGVVSADNSLVGSKSSDQVSSGGITALSNGNYVVSSPNWDNGMVSNAGAVTWGNGTTGETKGVVSPANSLVGSTAGDNVGIGGITALSNGNYVVVSNAWDNGTATDAGAVTWVNVTSGVTGVVSPDNSLVGSTTNDRVGGGGISELRNENGSNGNYVVRSSDWDNGSVINAGAVTWVNGTTGGVTGDVSPANSLVGGTPNDQVGAGGISVLSNLDYVVSSNLWDNGTVFDAGAVTWGSGTTGVTGVVSPANSLIGDTPFENVGSGGITPLTNGNYVVLSNLWDNGAVTDAGAVTWVNVTSGVTGVVSPANSLVGSSTGDTVGTGGITALSNGNYVVSSPNWNNGALGNAGAVTWSSGTVGVSGIVSAANSLVGLSSFTNLQSVVLDPVNANFFARFLSEGGGRVRVGSQAQDGFNLAPTNITLSVTSVPENSANGNVIGGLTATDPDDGETFTFTLTNNAGGRFGVNGTNLVVADGNLLDFETNSSHQVAIRVTDSVGNTFDKQFTITVTNIIEASTLTIAPTSATKAEGNSGTTPFTFTVTRSGDIDVVTTVSYAVTGSGVAPANAADFVGGVFPTGMVDFDADETSQDISIPVAGDTLVEDDEGFTVTLSSATNGATITTATATGTIQNDDGSTFTVTNTNDSGSGSLRQAILDANANPGQDLIQFSIGNGVRTINLNSGLPTITDPVIIDGTTQPGFVATPLIELNGANAGASTYGLFITAGSSTVRGLTINRFSWDGIGLYQGGSNVIEGNFLGTNPTGTLARGNAFRGIGVYESANNRIGGSASAQRNLISGNLAQGVYIRASTSTGNLVQGNFMGTDVTGTVSLANLDDGVFIDSGANGNFVGTDGDGVNDAAERNVISGNGGDGVQIHGTGTNNNVVAGNFIGMGATGAAALANVYSGVVVSGGAKQNRVGTNGNGVSDTNERNVIAGNTLSGVWISDAGTDSNWVAGNYIGINAAGTIAVPNGTGIRIRDGAKSNRVGSNADGANDNAERNVISGNTFDGISIDGTGTETNIVTGNYIGTNALGTVALANEYHGVAIRGAANNLIGGVTTAARNVISGNTFTGVLILEAGATGNKVQGNYMGTNAAGTAALPNHFNGVTVYQGASNNLIGGSSPGMGNVVSGNEIAGITIETAGTTGNVVQGNLVGVAADGVAALGNTAGTQSGWGILVVDADHNTIGGTASGERNVVAYNSGPGVAVFGGSAVSNAIRGNQIFAHGGLGIDLGSDGVTQNDSQDPDAGPNNLQNFPALSGASRFGTSTQILGTINSLPNVQFHLDFFASDVADATGYGEGKQFLGTTIVTTNGSGDASFDVTLPVTVPVGSMLTATATDENNNTSEFSQAIRVNAPPMVAVISDKTATVGSLLSFSVSATDPDGPSDTLTYTIEAGSPAGASINSSTGIFTWTPSASQGGQGYGIIVSVTDSGSPPFIVSQLFGVTVDDAAPSVTLSVSPASLAEATGTSTVTATLSAVSGQDVTIDLGFSGTATNETDYTRSATQIVIPAGDPTGTITLTAVQDTLDETNETIVVEITGVTNGTGSGTQQVTATIIDDPGDWNPVILATATFDGNPDAGVFGQFLIGSEVPSILNTFSILVTPTVSFTTSAVALDVNFNGVRDGNEIVAASADGWTWTIDVSRLDGDQTLRVWAQESGAEWSSPEMFAIETLALPDWIDPELSRIVFDPSQGVYQIARLFGTKVGAFTPAGIPFISQDRQGNPTWSGFYAGLELDVRYGLNGRATDSSLDAVLGISMFSIPFEQRATISGSTGAVGIPYRDLVAIARSPGGWFSDQEALVDQKMEAAENNGGYWMDQPEPELSFTYDMLNVAIDDQLQLQGLTGTLGLNLSLPTALRIPMVAWYSPPLPPPVSALRVKLTPSIGFGVDVEGTITLGLAGGRVEFLGSTVGATATDSHTSCDGGVPMN